MNLLALALWIGVSASTVLLFLGLRRSRPQAPGPASGLHDLSEAAFLSGGPGGVVDTALVSLLADGRLVVGGPGIVHVRPGARAADTAERAVLQAHQGAASGWLYQVRYAAMLDPAVQETGDALAARGLLSPPGSGRTSRRWALVQTVVCAVLIPVSLPLTFLAYALGSGPAVPFALKVVPALLGGIIAARIAAARARSRLTPAGARALRALRGSYANDPNPYVRTALFGLRGLRDPFLRQQLVPAARGTRLAAAQARGRSTGHRSPDHGSSADVLPVLWCAGSDGAGGGGGSGGCSGGGAGCSSGSGCGSSGGSGGGGGGGCGSSGSSCSSSSGSSCGSSSGSSCSSSS
ncbi:TIGR04222 domain-containing membrane protein [Streptomyces sp. NPDC002044]|uniref:TIGR04222 domain-containing membrane protein n=1 Tax=Streptomyces sp. NPDC002044 TaxID=3154662 RepID=UPI00332FB462